MSFTSKSTLMHASLAYLSSEIQTMDSIIQASPRLLPTWHTPILPTEILLLIRESLFPLIVTQLIQKSTAALEVYEHSLRNLLCPDCIVYNLDIYGPNIWQWEQFHGACACLEIENQTGGPGRSNLALQKPTTTTTPNPKQFTNADQWLEAHLSREASALLVRFRGHLLYQNQNLAAAGSFDRLATHAATCPPGNVTVDIWDAVAIVLREYNCEVVRPEEDETTSATLFHVINPKCREFIQIIPLLRHSTTAISAGFPDSETSEAWRAHATLCRAVRELRLDCIEPFGAHSRDPSSFKLLLWRSNPSAIPRQDHLHVFFGVMASLVAGCLTLPITCTTIAVSIFYFYSRPRSFRIF